MDVEETWTVLFKTLDQAVTQEATSSMRSRQ